MQTKNDFFLSFSNKYDVFGTFIDYFRVLCDPFQTMGGCIVFKIQFMIFECICFFEVILLSFFLTCVNTTECVVFKKVPPSCTRKSITLTDREHQEFFIPAVNR